LELYRSPGRVVNFLCLLDEKSAVVPVRLAGEQSGGKRKVSYGDALSNSERASPKRPSYFRFLVVNNIQKRGTNKHQQLCKRLKNEHG
jgi:hypothetical protein